VLMDDDEDHLAGSLEAQEQSGNTNVQCCICRNNLFISWRSYNGQLVLLVTETENTQKQQAKKQRKRRKKRRKEESKTSAIPCRGLDCQGHDRSSHGFLTEEIKKIASGLDAVKITYGNRDQNRVAQVLAKLSLQDASVSV
jgi:hypothetical protein